MNTDGTDTGGEPTDPAQRAGRYVLQPAGYRAYLPEPLPPVPPIAYDGELQRILSDADRDLARLDALAMLLPNPELFVAMYLRQEAVLSSQIEGTQSTLDDLLAFESGHAIPAATDVGEVVSYVRALNHGIARLQRDQMPLSLQLIREVHGELMQGQATPGGEFRTTQTWIGGPSLARAAFVPPPPDALPDALSAFERFLHAHAHDVPVLVRCALAHAQFATLHPFVDGNGRVGRLLATLMLAETGVLSQPLLYLSLYLNARQSEHDDRLRDVRFGGDWEGWLRFYLRGISETAKIATNAGRDILALRDRHRLLVARSRHALALLDRLFAKPYFDVREAAAIMDCSWVKANAVVRELAGAGIVQEITGHARNRVFRYAPYLAIFEDLGGGLPLE